MASAEDVELLSGRGLWRKHYTFFPPRLSLAGAKAKGVEADPASRAAYFAKYYGSGFVTPPPPAGWMRADFDDGAWGLTRGEEFSIGDSRARHFRGMKGYEVYRRGTDPFVEELGLICMRGAFLVPDPAKVRGLRLSLSCRGGFVAYLNGREIARGGVPAGTLAFDAAAEDYPLTAWFVDPGSKQKSLNWFSHSKSPQWAHRERRFGPIELPASALRAGRNVLAIELHRSNYPAELKRRRGSLGFSTVGLGTLSLTAETGAEAYPTQRERLSVWNADLAHWLTTEENPPPEAKLRPMRIVAARNGTFSCKVMVASARPIASMRAEATALRGASGMIGTDRLTVRYGVVNPTWAKTKRFDMLLDSPPADAAAVSVWLTVRVPKEAAAGRYTGSLKITAGRNAVAVPVELEVIDWTLPDVTDYASVINIYQSPDTLARYYKLDPWSEPHWRMIERSLRMMGEAGNIGLHVPLLSKSQYGNVESMIVWIRKTDGSFGYDFSRFDRYVATAVKYHTRLRFLVLGVWGYEASARRKNQATVTVRDAATGKTEDMALPAFGTAECEALWRPLLHALRDRLAAKALEKLILFGLPGDGSPNWQTVAMFRRILPGARWMRESHYSIRGFRYDPQDRRAVVPVAYNSIVWGGAVPDPAAKRLYGWRRNPAHVILTFNRAGASALNLYGFQPPWSFRMWMESTLAGGRNGNGRVGGDYWRIGAKFVGGGRTSSENIGGSGGTLYGIYLKSAVGQVGLGNSTTDLFAPGPDGPVATVRFVNACEGNQEAEARVFIEKALLDKVKPLPAALAARVQKLLDERTMILRMWPIRAARIAQVGWQERSRRLFEAAAEVARSLSSAR